MVAKRVAYKQDIIINEEVEAASLKVLDENNAVMMNEF